MENQSTINNILTSFADKKILIVGDVMIDTYLWGNVDRISPESPVPVVDVKHSEHRLGGAANVALNIKALGAKPVICSVVGSDAEGEIFIELLQKRNISIEGVVNSKNRHTSVKTRIFCRNHQMIRFDRETTDDISSEDAILLLDKFHDLLEKYDFDAVIMQDYNKGILSKVVIEKIIRESKAHDIFTAVDPKKKNFLSYKNVDLFKPNIREITDGLNIEINSADQKSLDNAAAAIEEKLHNKVTFITLSEKGIYIKDENSSQIVPAHHVRNVADVSGAGDTVISVATLGFVSGLSSAKAATLANIAGGIVCEEVGVIPIDPEKLKKEAETSFSK